MSNFKMKIEAADSSSRGPRDIFRMNHDTFHNDDFHTKPGHGFHAQEYTKSSKPDALTRGGYYDTHRQPSRSSQMNNRAISRGVYPDQNAMANTPADVSVIPWIRSLPTSCSEIDSRPQSCIKTEAEASSSGTNNTEPDFDRKKSAKAEPIRPIPQMVPADFLRRGMYPDISRPPSTAYSLRSTVLDFGSRNSSSFSSPRHSAVRRGQKRGLSISPLSADCIDLNAIIRTSPNSLVAFITGSRGSSAASRASRASGSYGHLSAASISPSPFCTPVPGFFGRQRNPFSTPSLPRTPSASISGRHGSLDHVSSSLISAGKARRPSVCDIKQEETSPCSSTRPEESDSCSETATKTQPFSDEEDESTATDFRCNWVECENIYDDQAGLVSHVNNDHIQKSKKDCTCYWRDCAREEKPFKAMYMLVVHVRRHTGEKPHACDFPGCAKAYSRLENLKTHRRSHTGERPYACEFEGCNKAFSNASDRAKHQNRTHSSVKQYGCKVEGCPKRYTDPSSLRKHMKTVHGAVAQPSKKMKGEKPESKKETMERKEKEKLEQRRKSVGECLTVKPLQQRSPGGNDRGSLGAFCNRVPQFAPSPSMQFPQGHPQNDNFGTSYRAWGVQQASPTSTTTDCESAEHSPLSQNAEPFSPGNRGPGIQVQSQPRQFLPRLSGKPRASEGLLNEVSRRLSDSRRMSNTSLMSVDSGAESMISSHNGSRRGSDISLQSYMSSRRSSLSSPMPPSRLSPRSIANQTVIEGKVFQSASPGTSSLLDQGYPDHIDPAHLQHNRQSRVSSGYGSQTAYFHCKSPALQQIPSPTPPAKGRRASDGNVTRLGDKLFEPATVQATSRNINRRGSEPISPIQILDQTPRRNSMSTYNPLPIPQSMRQSLSFPGEEDTSKSPRTLQVDQFHANQSHYIKPNLFVQRQNEVEVEPQFPPSEEELAQGSLFSSTSNHQHSSSLLRAADSTVPEPSQRRIPPACQTSYFPVMNNSVESWSSPRRNHHPSTIVAEADSSADWLTSHRDLRSEEDYEDLMVREIRGLSTGLERPHTNPYGGGSNMAINDMNTLLTSLNEENKFFESNRMGNNVMGNFL